MVVAVGFQHRPLWPPRGSSQVTAQSPGARLAVAVGVGRAQNTERNAVAWSTISGHPSFLCTFRIGENNKVKVCQYLAMEVGVCIILINLACGLWRIKTT